MDGPTLTLRNVRRYAPYRGGERNEHPNIPVARNVTEHEPNIPNIETIPLATGLKDGAKNGEG
ncbi:hypothetical protein J2R89_007113 [Bradyrhizobium elkanii]|nr:hypothetical protein [Bradyrhizobium elkanii]